MSFTWHIETMDLTAAGRCQILWIFRQKHHWFAAFICIRQKSGKWDV